MTLRAIDGIGVAVIAAAAGLLYAVGVRPLQTAHAETVRLKAELWIAKGTLSERRGSEDKATAAAQRLVDRLESLDIELANIDQLNARLAELTHTAEQHGLTIETLRPGEQVSQERYRAVAITLIGRAEYELAIAFLDELRRQYPDTGLQSMVFERLPGDKPTGRLQIGMVWYAAPAVSEGRAGGTPR